MGHLHAGAAPQSATIDKVTGQLAVKNLMGRSVTIFDLNASGTRKLNTFQNKSLPSLKGRKNFLKKFSSKTLFYHAEVANRGDFRMSSEGYELLHVTLTVVMMDKPGTS